MGGRSGNSGKEPKAVHEFMVMEIPLLGVVMRIDANEAIIGEDQVLRR